MSSSSSGPPLPTLIVTGGASDGLAVQLHAQGDEKTIGSAPNSHIRLTTRNVAASHARVSWEEGAVVLSDEGSAAGTFVNGEKISSGHVLQDGDRISVGPPGSPESVRLLVRVPADLGLALRSGFFPKFVEPAAAPAPVPAPEPESDELPAFAAPAEDEPILFEEAEPTPGLGAPAFKPPEPEPVAVPGTPAIILDEAPAPVPAAAAAPSPPVPAPAAPAAPAAPVRAPRAPAARPDYMSEIPSIGGDRAREAPSVPPMAAPAPRPARARRRMPPPSVPRMAIVGAAAAVVAGAAFYFYSRSQQPPPVLSAITPPKAEVGTTVTITGSGFAPRAGDNSVRFGDAEATVTNASATSLAVTVPPLPGSTSKEVPITVRAGGGRSNALFVKIARLPRITRLEPDVAVPGAEITLHGQNLDGAPVTVKIAGEKVAARDATGDSLRVKVPDIPWTEGQSVAVTIDVGPDAARAIPLVLGHLPLVLEVSPDSGPAGQRVTIKGRGFDPVATGNRVTIGGAPALVLSASATELRTAVPAGAASGAQTALPVVVEAHGATSGSRTAFAFSRSLSGMARLRFFPVPAPQGPPDRHAFVSSELGPVLVLTGKADAGSTAERADRVAEALTRVMETAITRPVSLEVREGATPAVAVSGGEAIVTATPDDADGYTQAWDGGARPGRSTPRQIAGYWAALLQDYVTLFGQGQRPSRTAELSSRGRVLVDIYAEAQRRGAAGGVPVATVYELSPTVLKTLREMALLVPAGGGAVGTAVAGRWEGTMVDETATEKGIELVLDVDGGKLGGSLTVKTGGLAVRTPLQQATYEKGQVKFMVSSGGGPRQFRGTLQGGTLEGSIFKDAAAKDKDAVGRFSLRYVE